jgi:hypothetical protein
MAENQKYFHSLLDQNSAGYILRPKNYHLFGKPVLPPFQFNKPLDGEDPALFARLGRYCARSYRWTRRKFAKEIAQDRVTTSKVFCRHMGPLSWQPRALIGMLISYVTLLFSFALIVTLILALPPIILSLWGDPDDPVHYAAGWTGSHFVEGLAWLLTGLSRLIIAPFTMLEQWLPASFVSIFSACAVVVGGIVGWILGVVREILFPFAFWLPAGLQEWFGGSPYWIQFFLYELRVMFGLAVFFGSLFGVLVLFFPWLASGRAFGLVDPDGKSVTIIFCGSTFLDNFTINACVLPYCGPLRHLGFHRAWSHIKGPIELWLDDVLPKGAKLVLAGHSLGGALAEIAAYDLAGRFEVSLVLAFGSSRIGGPTMQQLYKDRAKAALHRCSWHITHGDDAVPRLPPTRFFAHAGRGYLLSKTGELRLGERPAHFEDYVHAVETRTRMSRLFLNPAPLSEEEKQGRILLDPVSLRPLPVSNLEKFKAKARIFVFFVRDQAQQPVLWATAMVVALGFFILGMLAYYVLMLKRGFSGDHNVGLYRDALAERASRIFTDALLEKIVALPKGEWEKLTRSLRTAPPSNVSVDKPVEPG